MHADLPPSSSAPASPTSGPWYAGLTRYHWFVFVVAALGWLFDTMDQQLFNLARVPAMEALLPSDPDPLQFRATVAEHAGYCTAIFLIGWATGGLIFGVMGDRLGRAKTMLLTILIYSIFTGLSALSQNFWQFALFRFLTGLGVGGEFAVGIALLAEVMPDRARPFAIGWLQSLSAVGNITAAVIALCGVDWRTMFVIGTFPALLSILVRRQLKEPEKWQAMKLSEGMGQQLGSFKELFGDPRWRHNALVGLALAFVGVVGLWGIAFFSFDLVRKLYRDLPPDQRVMSEGFWVGMTSIVQNLGGFFGIQGFMWLTHLTNRRTAFFWSFLTAMISTALTFVFLGKGLGLYYDIFWMIPIMGLCQLALFGGYAIYFPELFPTRLRSTGTSFCYNVGRFVAAVGPLTLGLLESQVFNGYDDPKRWAGLSMCLVFFIGFIALPFAPETKGKPLPE